MIPWGAWAAEMLLILLGIFACGFAAGWVLRR